jgi:maleate isomerase
MLVPSSNRTMETEMPAMLGARHALVPDERFIFHSSRMRMKRVTPEELREMNAQTGRATRELAELRPDVVATACLVAIMAQGPQHHLVAENAIREVLAEEGLRTPVASSAGALVTSIKAIGARRVAIMTPYMKPLTQLVVDYLEDSGIEVVDHLSFEVADNLEVAALDPERLVEAWRRLDVSDADAIVASACVQMPSLPAVARIEHESGLPVLTAATATTYEVLSLLGLETVVPDAGYLLSPEFAAVRSTRVSAGSSAC